jgi:hypothetical protein
MHPVGKMGKAIAAQSGWSNGLDIIVQEDDPDGQHGCHQQFISHANNRSG